MRERGGVAWDCILVFLGWAVYEDLYCCQCPTLFAEETLLEMSSDKA
jgi:hypothetical protein